jgi:hypothetical protein
LSSLVLSKCVFVLNQIFINVKRDQTSKGKYILWIWKEKITRKGGKMFTHSKKKMVRRAKTKWPTSSHVWRWYEKISNVISHSMSNEF